MCLQLNRVDPLRLTLYLNLVSSNSVFSSSEAHKDIMSEIWTNGDTVI